MLPFQAIEGILFFFMDFCFKCNIGIFFLINTEKYFSESRRKSTDPLRLWYISHSIWSLKPTGNWKPTGSFGELEFSLFSSNKASTDINLLLLKSIVLTSVTVELDQHPTLFRIPPCVQCSLFSKGRTEHASESYFITETFTLETQKYLVLFLPTFLVVYIPSKYILGLRKQFYYEKGGPKGLFWMKRKRYSKANAALSSWESAGS